jgi:3-hydroxybutyryl-CoA dehydrogenase
VISPEVPVASNTSALPITLLQTGRAHPARFVGMHWLSPCHITRFLEVIRGAATDDATADATLALGRRCGKDPALVRKDVEGFLVNRLAYAVYREAFHLLETGVADVATIDTAFRNVIGLWGGLMGPFRWMDLTGLPAYAAVMQRLLPTLSRDTGIPRTMRELVAGGAKGTANGRGFYEYAPGEAERWQRALDDHVWAAAARQSELPTDPPGRRQSEMK